MPFLKGNGMFFRFFILQINSKIKEMEVKKCLIIMMISKKNY